MKVAVVGGGIGGLTAGRCSSRTLSAGRVVGSRSSPAGTGRAREQTRERAGMSAVPTARGGAVETDELGFTLVTECIVGPRLIEKELNWPDHTFAEAPRKERIADAVRKLEHAKDAGVDTIVDRVIPGLGRDVPLVKEIAEQVRVNIIVATGCYTWRDLPLYFVFRQKFPDLHGA